MHRRAGQALASAVGWTSYEFLTDGRISISSMSSSCVSSRSRDDFERSTHLPLTRPQRRALEADPAAACMPPRPDVRPACRQRRAIVATDFARGRRRRKRGKRFTVRGATRAPSDAARQAMPEVQRLGERPSLASGSTSGSTSAGDAALRLDVSSSATSTRSSSTILPSAGACAAVAQACARLFVIGGPDRHRPSDDLAWECWRSRHLQRLRAKAAHVEARESGVRDSAVRLHTR